MDPICGLWVDEDGAVHCAVARPDGSRQTVVESFEPFAWLTRAPAAAFAGVQVEALRGAGAFPFLARAESLGQYEAFLDEAKAAGGVDAIRPLESQFLLQRRVRMFGDLLFSQVRRCQLDIETGSEDGSFSDAAKPGDRVLAIGLQFGSRQRLLVLTDSIDAAEKALLEEFNAVLAAEDPDVIEGHNLFKFDLDYLRQRSKRLKVPCALGRFGRKATFRNSRLKVAERWIDFPRCDLPGRTVVDTYLLVQQYDV